MVFLFKTVKVLMPFIIALSASFVAFKVIMGGIAIFKFVQGFVLLMKALKAAALAQGILNVIMTANPIGLIVVGIAALIGAITLLIIKWDVISAAIKKNTQAFTLFLGPIGLVINAVLTLIKHWDTITKAFKDKGFIGGIKAIGVAIMDFMLAPLKGILQILSKIPGMSEFAKNALNKLEVNVGEAEAQRESPNKEEVKAQQSDFKGNINISGAPAGTTIESRSKGPNKVNMQLAGAAP